jgi:hypothetical protein
VCDAPSDYDVWATVAGREYVLRHERRWHGQPGARRRPVAWLSTSDSGRTISATCDRGADADVDADATVGVALGMTLGMARRASSGTWWRRSSEAVRTARHETDRREKGAQVVTEGS